MKSDSFGRVERVEGPNGATSVRRDLRSANWWARWLAFLLARREARALRALERAAPSLPVPRLISFQRGVLERTWMSGRPMQEARPQDPAYFREARRLMVRLHRAGVAHNDLAKEPNWLVLDDGRPGLVDFQLASVIRGRGRWFRLLAHEDLRHLLKHKRTYCPERLTERERGILARPSPPARWWRRYGKPVYLWFTRRVLGWEDREGAGDRGRV